MSYGPRWVLEGHPLSVNHVHFSLSFNFSLLVPLQLSKFMDPALPSWPLGGAGPIASIVVSPNGGACPITSIMASPNGGAGPTASIMASNNCAKPGVGCCNINHQPSSPDLQVYTFGYAVPHIWVRDIPGTHPVI